MFVPCWAFIASVKSLIFFAEEGKGCHSIRATFVGAMSVIFVVFEVR